MNIDSLPIGLVLDHSALAAYDMPILAVGETIREVWDTDQAIALPKLCIAAAIAAGADEMTVMMLLYEAAVQPVTFDFREIGRRARDFDGSLPFAEAALAAAHADAPVLTEYPDMYRKAGLMAVPLD